MRKAGVIEKYKSRRIRVPIRRVLMEKWDPIGVADEPMAQDEYDSYIGEIFGLLLDHTAKEVIADHLRSIELDRMGLCETALARDRRLLAVKALQEGFRDQMSID